MPTRIPKDAPARSAGERFAGGWEPSPLPPTAPDGGLVLAPVPESPPLCASLCQLGPCQRYHEIVSSMEAAEPTDGTAGTIHRVTLRTCYPHPGIEMDLGEDTVYECSRWDPLEPGDTAQLDARRERVRAANAALFTVPVPAPSSDVTPTGETDVPR